MKKYLLTIAAALVATLGFAQSKTVIEFEDTQARMLNVESNAIFKPMVVEIKMMDNIGKIRKEYKFDRVQLESLQNDVSNLRSWATFRASEDYDADVIVAATFDIVYNSEKKEGKVTIVGFPAKFDNWHPVNSSDLDWIRATITSRQTDKSEAEKTSPVNR